MKATPDNSLWKVRKPSRQFWLIHPQIPTWNQDTNQKTWKDFNKIIETKCVFIISSNMLKWKTAAQPHTHTYTHTHTHTHTQIYIYIMDSPVDRDIRGLPNSIE